MNKTIVRILLCPILLCFSTTVMADRAEDAKKEKSKVIADYYNAAKITYPSKIFLRAFKKERILELWAKSGENFVKITEYPFAGFSGKLGPKRHEGDYQIPEGIYKVVHFNPKSNYYLSMGIDYPNESDRIIGKNDLGGAIYIHGSTVTIGCIPITDDKIKELYTIALDAKKNGQNNIPVHIFPFKFNSENMLEFKNNENVDFYGFWESIKPIYDFFEENHKIPKVVIDKVGKYIIQK